ncbi:MAG: Rrf2 family transcriptional regulator [Firmicutes bacterium]|nr:Rrf2 family transcriptional regulator [Bacillota bacterium]
MRLSAKGEYGVRAMICLALNFSSSPVPLREIAVGENISQQFLEQIFAVLRREGLVHSTRGAKGGYSLAYPPEQICVGDIIRALDGPITPVNCLSEEEKKADRCGRADVCLARSVWEKLRDHINHLLDNISLKDMIQGTFEHIS